MVPESPTGLQTKAGAFHDLEAARRLRFKKCAIRHKSTPPSASKAPDCGSGTPAGSPTPRPSVTRNGCGSAAPSKESAHFRDTAATVPPTLNPSPDRLTWTDCNSEYGDRPRVTSPPVSRKTKSTAGPANIWLESSGESASEPYAAETGP